MINAYPVDDRNASTQSHTCSSYQRRQVPTLQILLTGASVFCRADSQTLVQEAVIVVINLKGMHITDSSYWIRGAGLCSWLQTWRPKDQVSIGGTDTKFIVRDKTGFETQLPSL